MTGHGVPYVERTFASSKMSLRTAVSKSLGGNYKSYNRLRRFKTIV